MMEDQTEEDPSEVFIIEKDSPYTLLKAQFDKLKEFLASKDYKFRHSHNSSKFSLGLVKKFAAENVENFVGNTHKWHLEERQEFGEYVISILALSGKTHYSLKNHFDHQPQYLLSTAIIKGQAKDYFVEFCSAYKIVEIVWKYFSSGYYRRKSTPSVS